MDLRRDWLKVFPRCSKFQVAPFLESQAAQFQLACLAEDVLSRLNVGFLCTIASVPESQFKCQLGLETGARVLYSSYMTVIPETPNPKS